MCGSITSNRTRSTGLAENDFNRLFPVHGGDHFVTFRQQIGFKKTKVTRFIIYNKNAYAHSSRSFLKNIFLIHR